MHACSLNISKYIVLYENIAFSDKIYCILYGISGKFPTFDRVILDVTALFVPACAVFSVQETGNVVRFVIDDGQILKIHCMYALIINRMKCISANHYVVRRIVL